MKTYGLTMYMFVPYNGYIAAESNREQVFTGKPGNHSLTGFKFNDKQR